MLAHWSNSPLVDCRSQVTHDSNPNIAVILWLRVYWWGEQEWLKNKTADLTVNYWPTSAGFTYRLDRLKPRASEFRGHLVKVYNIFNTVIELSYLCCHSVLYFLNSLSVIFLTPLHSRIFQNFKQPSSSSPLLKLIKHTSIFLHSWR